MAAYMDAGNVWTIRPYRYQPRGNFDFSRFYKEIAMSYGLGLRLDFDYFLVRLDTGMKAYNPQVEGSTKWAIVDPLNLRDNFAWHFAVGYPF
jgi:outer membrane protein assembly factor BamA